MVSKLCLPLDRKLMECAFCSKCSSSLSEEDLGLCFRVCVCVCVCVCVGMRLGSDVCHHTASDCRRKVKFPPNTWKLNFQAYHAYVGGGYCLCVIFPERIPSLRASQLCFLLLDFCY